MGQGAVSARVNFVLTGAMGIADQLDRIRAAFSRTPDLDTRIKELNARAFEARQAGDNAKADRLRLKSKRLWSA